MKNKFIIIILLLIIFSVIGLNSILSVNNSNNYDNWSISKEEYPKSEYHLDELPVSHRSAVEVKKFFEDSDKNHDGVLKEDEINTFDYKLKHSQYTFNGPYGYN